MWWCSFFTEAKESEIRELLLNSFLYYKDRLDYELMKIQYVGDFVCGSTSDLRRPCASNLQRLFMSSSRDLRCFIPSLTLWFELDQRKLIPSKLIVGFLKDQRIRIKYLVDIQLNNRTYNEQSCQSGRVSKQLLIQQRFETFL